MNSINKILDNWLNDLDKFSYKTYEELPDIDLYMDQVITYLEKQLQIFQTSSLDKQITPSMINNYVKGEVITAPISKRYNREHLALIEEVCTLKQVLSIADVKQIIDEKHRKDEVDHALVFNDFRQLVNEKNKLAINEAKEILNDVEDNDLARLTDLATNFAVTANAYINISKRILFLMKIYQDSLENKKKDKHEDDKKKEEN